MKDQPSLGTTCDNGYRVNIGTLIDAVLCQAHLSLFQGRALDRSGEKLVSS